MEDTKLFAQDCAVFFKKRLFTPDVSPSNLTLRINAVVYLMAQNVLSDLPRAPTIEDMVMGTKGPGGPHLEDLLHYLQDRHLTAEFFSDMPH